MSSRRGRARSSPRRSFITDRVYVAIGHEPEGGEGLGAMNCIDARKTGDITADREILGQ